MKITKWFFPLYFAAALALSCASTESAPPPASASAPAPVSSGQELVAALDECAAYFAGRLPEGAYLALAGIDAETMQAARYVSDELQAALQRSGKFRFVERENLDRVMDELMFQESGLVDDESAQGLGHLSGAETLVYGSLTSLGADWRLVVYAAGVRSGEVFQQAKTVTLPPAVAAPREGPDSAVDKAVYEMAKGLTGRKTVSLGRISLFGTQSVTDLSNYLLDRITESAIQRATKYRIGKTGQAADAVIEGSFTPLDGGAEVTLRLVAATEEKTILGSSKFAIPAAELSRRRLSVYPPEGDGYVTPAEAERLQKVIEQYDGADNAFPLSVTVDHPTGIYYDKEYLSFFIEAGRDCYIRISQVDIHGNVQVIYPLSADEPNFVTAGAPWTLPPSIAFQVALPRGVEYILVAAFDTPFEIEAPKNPQRITNVTVGEGFKARALVRKEQTGRVEAAPDADLQSVASAQCSYTILPRQ